LRIDLPLRARVAVGLVGSSLAAALRTGVRLAIGIDAVEESEP
jgi:hypothetical protein